MNDKMYMDVFAAPKAPRKSFGFVSPPMGFAPPLFHLPIISMVGGAIRGWGVIRLYYQPAGPTYEAYDLK